MNGSIDLNGINVDPINIQAVASGGFGDLLKQGLVNGFGAVQ
ncbi:hypothetical protein AAULR_08041, partial [Lacticaseibacillus rhamnosus MTCC 5462]